MGLEHIVFLYLIRKKVLENNLLVFLEKIAVDQELIYLETYASLFAYPFYERCWYQLIEHAMVSL